MESYILIGFGKEILSLRNFFMHLATKESRTYLLGYRAVAHWDEYKEIQEVKFERKMHAFVDTLKNIDARLYEQNKDVVNQGYRALEIFARIRVNVDIASKKSHPMDAIPFFAIYRNRKIAKSIFKEFISIQDIIIDLDKLGELIQFSIDIYARHYRGDDEIFKPSNVDGKKVIQHIDEAINIIERRIPLTKEKGGALLVYLFEVKAEMSREQPSWRKIVGALVIATAIISGISDASQAYNNIKSALDHIMGSSVVRDIPAWTRALTSPNDDEPE